MSCFSWLRKGNTGAVQFSRTLSEDRPISNDSANHDVSVGSLETPGGLAGIKQRMAALGHFLNYHGDQEDRVRLQPASTQTSKAAFATEGAVTNTQCRMQPIITSGKSDRVLIPATSCDDHGNPVSASPQPPTSASSNEGRNLFLTRHAAVNAISIESN